MEYTLVKTSADKVLTVDIPGRPLPVIVNSNHPKWQEIFDLVMTDGDPTEVVELWDTSQKLLSKFMSLTDRVAIRHGKVTFDGDEINDVLTDQILRFVQEDNEDFWPLVMFLENVYANPSEHSRTQLFNWLSKHEFAITDRGEIVGYKGVRASELDSFQWKSTQSGHAFVEDEDGEIREIVSDYVHQNDGDIVTMPRSEVVGDPSTACSFGLHVGNWRYAKYFSQYVIKVIVSPRDVVSVPTDSNEEKIRCCRYTIVHQVNAPDSGALAVKV